MAQEGVESTQKVKTRFPSLHAAMGVRKENIEVLPPADTTTPPADTTTPPADTTTPPADIDFSKYTPEQKNELLRILTGGKLNNVEDLEPPVKKTKEQIEKEDAERKRDVLAWAIKTEKLSQKDYETSLRYKDMSSRDLALAVFTESLQQDDPDISAAEAEEVFKDLYHEDQKVGSILHTRGLKEIENVANAFRDNKVNIYDKIEAEYNSELQTKSQHRDFKKVIKSISDAQPKEMSFSFDYKGVDGADKKMALSVPIDEKVISSLVSEMTADRAFAIRNVEAEGKFDAASLESEMQYHLKARIFDTIIPKLLSENSLAAEKALMVELGNKRHEGSALNDGNQIVPGNVASKTNTYPSLNKFHKNK